MSTLYIRLPLEYLKIIVFTSKTPKGFEDYNIRNENVK